ncbi:hypothetical protein GGX14DRAFT_384373 [Mycena pura]|uniref:Uncharacterized protein n=1 Tax=Mycena pura TaxID=153505 RepID=A0AAD6YV67_9AGAR|nr:hypothetical protein GGX14DRAFT_384373 [Mycena pura]
MTIPEGISKPELFFIPLVNQKEHLNSSYNLSALFMPWGDHKQILALRSPQECTTVVVHEKPNFSSHGNLSDAIKNTGMRSPLGSLCKSIGYIFKRISCCNVVSEWGEAKGRFCYLAGEQALECSGWDEWPACLLSSCNTWKPHTFTFQFSGDDHSINAENPNPEHKDLVNYRVPNYRGEDSKDFDKDFDEQGESAGDVEGWAILQKTSEPRFRKTSVLFQPFQKPIVTSKASGASASSEVFDFLKRQVRFPNELEPHIVKMMLTKNN